MTDEQVIKAIGQPTRINSSVYKEGELTEQWIYENHESDKSLFVYLKNKEVTSLSW